MASARRDRHGRGLRGPLAAPNQYTRVARPVRAPNRAEFFDECVSDSLDRIQQVCPQALQQVTVGVEDVPDLPSTWIRDAVPLAAAVEATPTAMARVVVYRRPLEARAASRRGLRILVHRTIVEQIAAVTGLEVATIDPDVEPPDL